VSDQSSLATKDGSGSKDGGGAVEKPRPKPKAKTKAKPKAKAKSKPATKHGGAERKFRVGVDLGGTKTMALVFDEHYHVVGREKSKTKATRGDKALYADIEAVIKAALRNADVTTAQLVGIGIGVPGPVANPEGRILFTPNLPFKNFPMRARLQKTFKVPVAVDNDVNVGVLAELYFGAAEGKRHVLGVFPGTGIGGGLIVDGRIMRGASGAAGEIGHTLIDPEGPMCGCGRRGCLEAFCARPAIAAQAAVLAMRGAAPYLAANVGTDPADIRSGALARAAKAGDKAIEDLVAHTARRMGRGLSGILNALSPGTVVLGGGLVGEFPKLFVDEVTRGIRESVVPPIAKALTVVVAVCGGNAVAIGAAKLVDEMLGLHDERRVPGSDRRHGAD